MRAFLKKLLIILFWLAVWQLLSLAVHNVILLSGPFETLKALWALLPTKDFWISVATSLARILVGFLAGSAAGILLASLSASSSSLLWSWAAFLFASLFEVASMFRERVFHLPPSL